MQPRRKIVPPTTTVGLFTLFAVSKRALMDRGERNLDRSVITDTSVDIDFAKRSPALTREMLESGSSVVTYTEFGSSLDIDSAFAESCRNFKLWNKEGTTTGTRVNTPLENIVPPIRDRGGDKRATSKWKSPRRIYRRLRFTDIQISRHEGESSLPHGLRVYF